MVIADRPELDSLEEAIRIAGSQSELARQIGVAQASVWKMLHKAQRASAEFVLKIEGATGISRHDLRPDLYPREDTPALPSAGSLLLPADGPVSSTAKALKECS